MRVQALQDLQERKQRSKSFEAMKADYNFCNVGT